MFAPNLRTKRMIVQAVARGTVPANHHESSIVTTQCLQRMLVGTDGSAIAHNGQPRRYAHGKQHMSWTRGLAIRKFAGSLIPGIDLFCDHAEPYAHTRSDPSSSHIIGKQRMGKYIQVTHGSTCRPTAPSAILAQKKHSKSICYPQVYDRGHVLKTDRSSRTKLRVWCKLRPALQDTESLDATIQHRKLLSTPPKLMKQPLPTYEVCAENM